MWPPAEGQPDAMLYPGSFGLMRVLTALHAAGYIKWLQGLDTGRPEQIQGLRGRNMAAQQIG